MFVPSDRFLDRSNCIIWQYGNYTAKSVNKSLNGVNTQGENIADNGGIKEAYRAYNSWVGRHGEEPRLPGLEGYSQHQVSPHLRCDSNPGTGFFSRHPLTLCFGLDIKNQLPSWGWHFTIMTWLLKSVRIQHKVHRHCRQVWWLGRNK